MKGLKPFNKLNALTHVKMCKIDLEVTFPDLMPSDYAALLGHTYSAGQIVEAAREQFQEAETDMADLGWLSGNLPDGTFRDLGEVLAALMPVVAWRGKDASALLAALPPPKDPE